MGDREVREALDAWHDDVLQEFDRALSSGCHVPDIVDIAVRIANSHMKHRRPPVQRRAGSPSPGDGRVTQ